MRLGKNKVALPKLYIFPAFRELLEEVIDLHSSERNRVAAWGHPSPAEMTFAVCKRAPNPGGERAL